MLGPCVPLGDATEWIATLVFSAGAGLVEKPIGHWLEKIGAERETRTLTRLPPPDFESGASTSFATSA